MAEKIWDQEIDVPEHVIQYVDENVSASRYEQYFLTTMAHL